MWSRQAIVDCDCSIKIRERLFTIAF